MRRKIKELLAHIMATEEGREFIFELLEATGANKYGGITLNSNIVAYTIGRRSIGEELLEVLRNDIDDGLKLELLMRQEARARPKEKPKDPYGMFEGGVE